jgi:hypothetical protein
MKDGRPCDVSDGSVTETMCGNGIFEKRRNFVMDLRECKKGNAAALREIIYF